MWFNIKKTNSAKIIIESLLHQLAKIELNKNLLIKKINKCYGNPKLCIVYVNTPVETSIKRMIQRGDVFKHEDKMVIKRYNNSFKKFKELYEYSLNEHENVNFLLKPIYLSGLKTVEFNANQLKMNIS